LNVINEKAIRNIRTNNNPNTAVPKIFWIQLTSFYEQSLLINRKAALRCSVWDRALNSKDREMYEYTIFYTCILARSITNHLT
jgi:hypothetical protein